MRSGSLTLLIKTFILFISTLFCVDLYDCNKFTEKMKCQWKTTRNKTGQETKKATMATLFSK